MNAVAKLDPDQRQADALDRLSNLHVIRRYTFKLYPTKAQAEVLDQMRRLHCTFYNAALQERNDAYRPVSHARREVVCVRTYVNSKGEERGVYRPRHLSLPPDGQAKVTTPTYFDQDKMIKVIRAADPAYAALSADSLSYTLDRLDLAFRAFFQRAKAGAGAQSGYPRYKRSDDYPGFTHRPGQGWRFDLKPGAHSGRTTFKGVPGAVKWRGQFPAFPYAVKTGDVMLRAGVWWLSVVVELPARMHAATNHSGEVTFDLVDSFARVSRVDSGHAAGPEETVFAAADGRITSIVSGVYQESAADTRQTDGDRGIFAAGSDRGTGHGALRRHAAADTRQTEGDRGPGFAGRRQGGAADTQQTDGDRGHCHRRYSTVRVVGNPQTDGDRGIDEVLIRVCEAADTQQANSDRVLPVINSSSRSIKRRSCRDRRIKRRAARQQARQARQRREALHVWTTQMARRFAMLKITTPPILEATQSGRGNEYEHGAEVALKARLNRRILAQAPGSAIAMLEYKIAERGGVTETIVAPGPVLIGNDIVAARKATRKIMRKPKGPPST